MSSDSHTQPSFSSTFRSSRSSDSDPEDEHDRLLREKKEFLKAPLTYASYWKGLNCDTRSGFLSAMFSVNRVRHRKRTWRSVWLTWFGIVCQFNWLFLIIFLLALGSLKGDSDFDTCSDFDDLSLVDMAPAKFIRSISFGTSAVTTYSILTRPQDHQDIISSLAKCKTSNSTGLVCPAWNFNPNASFGEIQSTFKNETRNCDCLLTKGAFADDNTSGCLRLRAATLFGTFVATSLLWMANTVIVYVQYRRFLPLWCTFLMGLPVLNGIPVAWIILKRTKNPERDKQFDHYRSGLVKNTRLLAEGTWILHVIFTILLTGASIYKTLFIDDGKIKFSEFLYVLSFLQMLVEPSQFNFEETYPFLADPEAEWKFDSLGRGAFASRSTPDEDRKKYKSFLRNGNSKPVLNNSDGNVLVQSPVRESISSLLESYDPSQTPKSPESTLSLAKAKKEKTIEEIGIKKAAQGLIKKGLTELSIEASIPEPVKETAKITRDWFKMGDFIVRCIYRFNFVYINTLQAYAQQDSPVCKYYDHIQVSLVPQVHSLRQMILPNWYKLISRILGDVVKENAQCKWNDGTSLFCSVANTSRLATIGNFSSILGNGDLPCDCLYSQEALKKASECVLDITASGLSMASSILYLVCYSYILFFLVRRRLNCPFMATLVVIPGLNALPLTKLILWDRDKRLFKRIHEIANWTRVVSVIYFFVLVVSTSSEMTRTHIWDEPYQMSVFLAKACALWTSPEFHYEPYKDLFVK